MKLKDIINIIEKNYPPVLAYEWDNSGFILGNRDNEIKKCIVTLDITDSVVDDAVKNGANLIISHHPIIFSGIKKINTDNNIGKILLRCASHNISLYAAHTNMDTAQNGINVKLAAIFNLADTVIIEPNSDYKGCGLGVLGHISPISLCDFLGEVKDNLNTPFVKYSGFENQIISSVAIGSGSCADLIPAAKSLGADTIITGDIKYHTALDYSSYEFSIIDAGHFPTEQIVRDMFSDILINADIEIIKSNQKDIFKIF